MQSPSYMDGHRRKHKKLNLKPVPEHLAELWQREMESVDSYQAMHDFLAMVKANPVLLASWDMDMTFEEACRKYGVE